MDEPLETGCDLDERAEGLEAADSCLATLSP